MALAVGERLVGTPACPTALVLLSTPGRPLDAVIHEQLMRLLAKQQATPEQTKYFLDEDVRIAHAIKDTGKVPDDVPAGLKALYPAYLGKFLQSDFATDPSKLAARVSGPVLVVIGEMDIQVSPERDARPLIKALGTRTGNDSKLIIAPKASHNLKRVKDDREPGQAGEIAPEVLDELCGWVSVHLAR